MKKIGQENSSQYQLVKRNGARIVVPLEVCFLESVVQIGLWANRYQ